MNKLCLTVVLISFLFALNANAQNYPPDKQLEVTPMSKLTKPGYLKTVTDPILGTLITRIGNEGSMGGGKPYHHYAKTQPWNSDGTLIFMEGWPSAILNGSTYAFIKTVMPSGGHHTWSNTQPNIMYGSDNNKNFVKIDVTTGKKSTVHTFSEYTSVDYGMYEGNMSNDDRYVALFAAGGKGPHVICYDLVGDSIMCRIPASQYPNNCAMSQSGKYVVIQWDRNGSGKTFGIGVYNTKTGAYIRNCSTNGVGHYDYGIDADGNDVCVGSSNSSSAITMTRLDNGTVTTLIDASKMGWPLHISCRNLNRPGWAYISDFSASYEEASKANYQKMFAVKLDPAATGNAVTETFAFVRHQVKNEIYDHCAFGVANRDGSIAMFHSDWADVNGEVDSYVATYAGGGSDDVLAPSVPTNVSATNFGSSSCDLSWTASTDNVAVTGYNIYSNGIQVGTTNGVGNTAKVNGISCGSTNLITVKARDAYYNLSDASEAVSVTTTACSASDGYRIFKTSFKPSIDGNLAEFNKADSVTFGIAGGASTVAKAMWDSVAIYFAFKVTDKQLNAKMATRDDIWGEDAMEVFIDKDHDKGGSMLEGDYQFIVNILNKQMDLGAAQSVAWNATWQSAVVLNGTNNKNSDTDKGYTMEIAIPWSEIGFTSSPLAGKIIGLDFAVDDKTASNLQYVMWPNITGGFANPDVWQLAFLGDSVTTEVKAVINNNLVIFPNPATSKLTVTNLPVNANIKVYSMDGKMVEIVQTNNNNSVEFDVTNWKKGLYLFQVHSDKGVVIKKAIVE